MKLSAIAAAMLLLLPEQTAAAPAQRAPHRIMSLKI
jgi:hypothetical protein